MKYRIKKLGVALGLWLIAGAASAQPLERAANGAAANANLDEDEDQLTAYNAYLARINAHGEGESGSLSK